MNLPVDLQFVWSTLSDFFHGPVGAFLALVAVDNVFGVALALKNKTFAWKKALSFVESQFATQVAVAIVVTAMAVFLTDGSLAAWAALVASCVKASASVVADTKVKLFALAGMPVAASAGN